MTGASTISQCTLSEQGGVVHRGPSSSVAVDAKTRSQVSVTVWECTHREARSLQRRKSSRVFKSGKNSVNSLSDLGALNLRLPGGEDRVGDKLVSTFWFAGTELFCLSGYTCSLPALQEELKILVVCFLKSMNMASMSVVSE